MKHAVKHRLVFLSLVVVCQATGYCLMAQEEAWRLWATELAESYAGEAETEDLSYWVEDLLALIRTPLNLNRADREDLERLFFLSDLQIEHILFKRYVNGPFYTIYELQAVEGLPVETIRQMEPLVYLGSVEQQKGPLRVWGDLFIRSGFQLEKAEGFKEREGEEAPFRGDRFKHYLRMEMETNRWLSGGLIVEKDPGEPFYSASYPGADLMSGYVRYAHPGRLLSEAVVGQYHMSAGQGLVMRSGMPARKSSMVTSIRSRGASFRPSLSSSEAYGQRGGYFTLTKGNLEMTPFFSWKGQSARWQTDSVGELFLTGLKNDGLHRTDTEICQRNKAKELIAGSKLVYDGRWLTLEGGYLYYHLSDPLRPAVEPYNRFYFSGHCVRNSWLAYTITTQGILFFGETALSGARHPAFWNGVVLEVASGLTLAMGHRYIPKAYQAPLAGPLSESGRFAGEQGFYTGIEWQLPGQVLLSSYFDRYRFSWLKYQINGPSKGFDWHVQGKKLFSEAHSLLFQYRYREKPVNVQAQSQEKGLGEMLHNQIKLQYSYHSSENWQSTALAQWHSVNNQDEHSRGMMLAHDLRIRALKKRMTITCRYALFNTGHYDSRLYAYEPNVLYQFSIPAYSGVGSRYLLLVNYKLTPNLHVWGRATRWVYSDREEIGSGNNLILGRAKTEFTFQVRMKF